MAPAGATVPLLGAADWAALKQICAPSPTAATAPPGTATTAVSGTTSGKASASEPEPAGGTNAGGGQK